MKNETLREAAIQRVLSLTEREAAEVLLYIAKARMEKDGPRNKSGNRERRQGQGP